MSRSKSLRQQAWEKCGGLCMLCGFPMFVSPSHSSLLFTVEHIIPKCRGGTNDIDNLSGSHSYCNNYKGDALIEELPPRFRPHLRWKIRHILANLKV